MSSSRLISLTRTHPQIAADWHPTANGALTAQMVSQHSSQRVWWLCKNGHEYSVSPASRVRSLGCKVCLRPQKNENIRKSRFTQGRSIALLRPDLLSEWSNKNTYRPEDLSVASKKKVWWICKQGHDEWLSVASNRTVRNHGCPACALETQSERTRAWRFKKSGTSLLEKYPEVVAEWNYEKNNCAPNNLSPYSNLRAHWQCKYGHEWEATIDNRTKKKSNCPECNPASSKVEIYLLAELRHLFENVHWRKKIDGTEIDIFIPSINIGIEIDGSYWHRNKVEKDKAKDIFIDERGISLIRIRDQGLPSIGGLEVLYRNGEPHFEVVKRLLELIALDHNSANISKYLAENRPRNESEFRAILARLPAPPSGETLLDLFPEISGQWDYEKNAPLRPEYFSYGSDQKMYWVCDHGHHWKATIKNRTLRGSGCPHCYSRKKIT